MSQEQFDALLKFFKALSNESRLKIVGLLANGPMSVSELAAELKIKEPTVSHHLSTLRELGLVSVQARNNLRIYKLNSKMLERMSREMMSPEQVASLVDKPPRKSWEQKIRDQFIVDGRIAEALPMKQKKQMVILSWLVQKFEPETRYPEVALNKIIKQYHHDTAYLRRRMVSFGFMARHRSVYWRIDKEGEPAGKVQDSI